MVEAEGDDVVATLAALPGVSSHSTSRVDGRARVELIVTGGEELRPTISGLAGERGWTLWELHRERASLEQLFRELTGEPGRDEIAGAPLSGEAVQTGTIRRSMPRAYSAPPCSGRLGDRGSPGFADEARLEVGQATLKWANLIGVPLLFVALGATRVVQRRRRSDRSWEEGSG